MRPFLLLVEYATLLIRLCDEIYECLNQPFFWDFYLTFIETFPSHLLEFSQEENILFQRSVIRRDETL